MAKMWTFFKDQGYVWDTGLSGHLTYAPNGKLVKNNLENHLRRQFTYHGFQEVETPLIFRQEVWEQSGHWQKFQDPMIQTKTGNHYRIDKLLEEQAVKDKNHSFDYASLTPAEICDQLRQMNTKRPPDDPFLVPEDNTIEYQSLMMRTLSGHQMSGLRPETATATYFHYKELLMNNGNKYPINVFQIGKSFRNEISPKHNLIRGREFTQAEFQVILPEEQKAEPPTNLTSLLDLPVQVYNPSTGQSSTQPISALKTANPYYSCLMALTYQTIAKLGVPQNNMRLRQHSEKEMAFYALDAWDIEVNLKDLGWTEIAGIHDRGGYDLRHLQDEDATSPPPHILEVAIGVDRLFYAILDNLYEEKDVSDGKSMWKIPYFLSTIQVSVCPLVRNKEVITDRAMEIYEQLRTKFSCEYLDKQSIGKRYLKNAKRGIPYTLTIDFETIEEPTEEKPNPDFNTVTVRDRDTENQVRVPIPELAGHLFQRLNE